jgi:hypothetical protein
MSNERVEEVMALVDDFARAVQHDFSGFYVVKDQALVAKAAIRTSIERLAGVAEGWKLVPIEPTQAMLSAAANTPGIRFLDETSSLAQLRRPDDYAGRYVGEGSPLQQAWGAMLAASPVSLTKGAAGGEGTKDGWLKGSEVQCGICQAIKVMGAGCDRDDCPCSERMCGHG